MTALTEAGQREASPSIDSAPVVALSVIVPTFNEASNVATLVERLSAALHGIRWEVIFVDDSSPDGTADAVRAIAQRNARVRCVQRIGRRGLASACIEGALSSSAPFVAVIDGDLQHDETLLPEMFKRLSRGDLDVVIGSRYADKGGFGSWSANRIRASKLATRLAKKATRVSLSDPMSGFFMIRRDTLVALAPQMSSIGFKILLDIFASSKTPLRFEEIPYHFRARGHGDSKLEFVVLWEYAMLLIDKLVGRHIPARLISFSIIGALGVAVHLSIVYAFLLANLSFIIAQTVATFAAMTFNFLLNNLLTYSDMRLRGRKLLFGWITFVLACSVGAAANVGVAGYMFSNNQFWALSALAGIAVGTVWNFAITSIFTWKRQ